MSRVVVNEIQAKVGNDISFNDAAKIDTLKGKTTAGSINVQGDGSATTNLQQGLCKAWNFFDGTASTIAYEDSFNSSTLTDIGGGQYKYAFTNNMSNANFSFGGAAVTATGNFSLLSGTEIAGGHPRSTSSSGRWYTSSTVNVNSALNANSISTQIFGDLA